MLSKSLPAYRRPIGSTLASRLHEHRRFLQVVLGPRQSGKTTLVRQVAESASVPLHFASADEPVLRGSAWLAEQWDAARILARSGSAILVLDEIQKASGWSESVKRLWDEDTRDGRDLRVVVLGSAPLLIQRGLTESLAGRFETIRIPHWSASEMRDAFGWGIEQFIYFGGYPGAAPLIDDQQRWKRYIRDALVETTISRDVLLLTRVDKPALLRRLFDLAARSSGQILSYTKMLGQLHEAGNATTLAHYLDLLTSAGMVTGLPKYAGHAARQRGSSPKLAVLNTALTSALHSGSFEQVRADREYWGQLAESAVGSHLANAAATGDCELFYWRERSAEVDFVVRRGDALTAIEVKSGRAQSRLPGMDAFVGAFRPKRTLLVGSGGISIEEFLRSPVERWTE